MPETVRGKAVRMVPYTLEQLIGKVRQVDREIQQFEKAINALDGDIGSTNPAYIMLKNKYDELITQKRAFESVRYVSIHDAEAYVESEKAHNVGIDTMFESEGNDLDLQNS